MNNRKRANRIASGAIATILLSIVLVATFPYIFMSTLLIGGAIIGLYYMFKIIRDLTEDTLDDHDKNAKWKQDKNIK